MRFRTIALVSLCSAAFACKQEQDQHPGGRAPAPQQHVDTAQTPRLQATASNAAVANAEQSKAAQRLEGPIADNMGRNFSGRLQLAVNGKGPAIQLRYFSQKERSRLQIERPGSGSAPFDAIFAGDQLLVLDNAARRYRAHDLDEVEPRAKAEGKISIERNTDRRMLAGLACYPWQLTADNQKISACVRGLPGKFDTRKFETVSGFDVPPWVETLLEEGYLPVSATVTENGRELYRLDLVQYTPDPVPDNELSVPANYAPL